MILLSDALRQMEKCRTTFSIRFVAHNISKYTGGEFIELDKAYRVKRSNKTSQNDNIINIKQKGNNHHPIAVHIHLITRFNDEQIFI